MSFIFLRNRVTGGAAFSPASLFSSGEEGAWYEPSTTTCFTATWTGSAFTNIAAAGYGDLVAIMEDQSGNGNDATQTDSSKRPILARVPSGGRRNLATTTELDDTLVWTQDGLSSLTGGQTDPNGGTDAFLLTENTGSAAHRIYFFRQYASGTVTVQIKAKAVNHRYINFNLTSFSSGSTIVFDLQTPTVSDQNGANVVSSNASGLGGGWVLCTATVTVTNTTAGRSLVIGGNDGATYDDVYVGSGTDAFYLSDFQLEAGSTATAYQKVVDQYDITEAGVTSLDYLAFDGSDDGMASTSASLLSALNGSNITLFVASDEEMSVNVINTSAGDQYVEIQQTVPNGNRAIYRNTSFQASALSYAAPSVIVGSFNATAKTALARSNGVDGTVSAATTSTLTSASQLTIGALDRNTTDIFYAGKLFGALAIDRLLTAQEISDTESYLAAKSGVTLP